MSLSQGDEPLSAKSKDKITQNQNGKTDSLPTWEPPIDAELSHALHSELEQHIKHLQNGEKTMTDINEILVERESTHGNYSTHAAKTQELKAIIREADCNLTPQQQEALEMIAHKIGRILAGNPSFKDHWVDIAGYATLVANLCEE